MSTIFFRSDDLLLVAVSSPFDKRFLETCLAFLADTCYLALLSELLLMLSGDVESNPGPAHVPPEAPICRDANNRLLMVSADADLNPEPSDTLDEENVKLVQNHESVSRTLNDIKRDQRSIHKTVNESAIGFRDLHARLKPLKLRSMALRG